MKKETLKSVPTTIKIMACNLLLFVVFLFGGCGSSEVYPKYEYAVDYYTPDTMQTKMIEWVKETIRATDQHLSAGDYEDPEDVILQAEATGKKLFVVRAEGLHKYEHENQFFPEFIPKERMIDWEMEIYMRLCEEKNNTDTLPNTKK